MRLSELMVRKRLVFLVVAVVLAIVCAFLIPHTKINTDMTRYLPDDSQTKQGITRMSEEFGEDGVGTGMVRVMFWSLPDSLRTATKDELSDMDGISNVLYQPNEEYNQGEKVLYELLCSSQYNQHEIAKEIADRYGSKVIVETSENDTTAPMGVILIAFVLLLIVLFVMCESWLEPPIFLAAIGVAVAINMGTNALLSSVSATTNSIAAILQLVLSIDYSIILMNCYRQEKLSAEGDKVAAMTRALKKASSSIVSSAFTTMVGLMALVFMKLKIGADMGIVLAKGVLCSLVSVFTVLPAIILALDGAIVKSTKRVLKIKTERLAGFSVKFRIPLTIAFVVIFASAYYLHKKTDISFSFEQKSEIAKYFPQKNILVLLYDNSDSEKVIGLSDSLASNPNVKTFLSYPSLMQKPLTVADIQDMFGNLSAMAGDVEYNVADYDIHTIVDAIYYIHSEDPGKERMSLHDFALLAAEQNTNEDESQYLDILVSLTDTSLIDRKLTSEEISDIIGVDKELVSLISPENQKTSIREIVKSAKELLNESVIPIQASVKAPEVPLVEQQVEVVVETEPVVKADTVVEAEPASVVADEDKIYKDSTIFMRQYAPSEIAQIIGMKEKSASMIFNIYGRSVGQKTKTMSLYAFIHFINSDLSQRKLYASQIDKESRKWLKHKEDLMQAALQPIVTENVEPEVQEPKVEVEETPVEPVAEVVEVQEEPEPEAAMPNVDRENIEKLDKAERLLAIAKEGSRFSAVEMHGLLHELGAEVKMSDVELAYLFYGISHFDDTDATMTAEEILQTLNDSIMANPRFASIIGEEMRSGMEDINAMIDKNIGMLRGDHYSQAIMFSDLPKESEATGDFVEALSAQCDAQLAGSHYLVGESVMMTEMRNQFDDEMLLVTLITVLSIFLIVAITFRSLAVPFILVMTVMTAVYINVAVSGLNGSLLYLAYLIMQSILMGATIDYGILFTNNYREARASSSLIDSIRKAYQTSTHTIFTSGTIMTLAPFAMSFMLDDTTTVKILQCIAAGAFAAVLLIIFVLPGLLATFDRFVVGKKGRGSAKQ